MVDTIRVIARAEASKHWSAALAVVTSVHSGEGTPELSATVALRETGLVLPRVPIAVGVLGLAAPPVEGDLVLVAFAGGDLHAPVLVGRLYDEQVAPPQSQPGQAVVWLPRAETDPNKRIALTVDTPPDGPRTLTLAVAADDGTGVEVTVTDGKVVLAVGQATVTLTQSSSSDGQAEIAVGDAKLTLTQSGDVTVEAKGTLSLKGSTVEINGQSDVTVTGQTIKLN